MVKIAIAGGTSNVALEVIDALCATNKHEIILLSRKDVPVEDPRLGISWVQTDYRDVDRLTQTLSGVHTVLSFIVTHLDPGNEAQRNVIDAAVAAGVKRFAPSEWATSNLAHQPWYAGKGEIRAYLAELNREQKILEYSLFQPGLFTNYLTHPHKSATHFRSFETQLDFQKRRALVVQGSEGSDRITLTTVQDFAAVVARAIEFTREWPVVGGIKGSDFSIEELLVLGEKLRGAPFVIDRLKAADLEAGLFKGSWLPTPDHAGVRDEMLEALVVGMLLATSAGALAVTDEWNRLLPDYRFARAEDFLTAAWAGRAT